MRPARLSAGDRSSVSVLGYYELSHHSGILVFQNMAVCHVGGPFAGRMREAKKNIGHTTSRDWRYVFPTRALGLRRVAVPRQDPELAAVKVHGMQHPVQKRRRLRIRRSAPTQRLRFLCCKSICKCQRLQHAPARLRETTIAPAYAWAAQQCSASYFTSAAPISSKVWHLILAVIARSCSGSVRGGRVL
jgi:hypothetical protein